MQTKSHNGVGTLTNPLADKVMIEVLDRTIISAKLVISWLAILEVFKDLVLWVPIFFLGVGLRLILSWHCRCITSALWHELIVIVGCWHGLLLSLDWRSGPRWPK